MHQTAKSISTQRNYGIDLLRLVAAFYVVVLHTTGLGGIFGETHPDTYQNYICRFILIFTMPAVNIFGIISGYVGYREGEKKAPFSSLFTLWLTVVLYSVLYIGIFHILLPGSVSKNDLLTAFFPVTFELYWYFSAYVLVYLLSPFLNKILYNSTEKELRYLFFLIFVVFVLIEYLQQPFEMERGYSAIWLLMLYLIGGIIKKVGIGKQIPSFAAFFAIFLINITLFYLWHKYNVLYISLFSVNFIYDHSYVSPFYLTSAILHVILFSRFNFSTFWKKLVRFAAPAAFSVYILNTNIIMWNNFMWEDFMQHFLASWATSSPAGILARIILFSLAFVVVAVIIDFFRQKLFRLLGVQKWPEKIYGFFQKDKAS